MNVAVLLGPGPSWSVKSRSMMFDALSMWVLGWSEASLSGDFLHSNPSPHIEKVVGVLVLSPVPEGERLEYREGARTAYRDCSGGLLSGRGYIGQ